MKAKQPLLLLHPVFLACLAALLLNDFFLKYEFHNGVTGKLSDFAGLLVFAVFLIAIAPRYRKLILIICGLFFCWWKSPLSEGTIGFVNDRLHLPVIRVIDYTDWWALLALLPAYLLKPVAYPPLFLRQAAVCLSGIASLFAFCATSMPRHLQADTPVRKNIRTPLKRNEIRKKISEQNVTLQQDTAYFRPLYDQDIYVKTTDSTGANQMLLLRNYTKGELYYKWVPYDSSYTIPWLLIKNDTLKNIRFSIGETPNGKKRIIRLQSFRYDTVPPAGTTLDNRLRKKYRRPLINEIKSILQGK